MTLNRWAKYKLPVDVRGFRRKLKYLNGESELPVELWQLVWSAVMVGFPGFLHLAAPPGSEAWWTCMHRVSIVKGFLDGDDENYLGYSGSYRQADASEKAVVSYYLGMIAAKVVAGERLGVWQLRHYDRFYEEVHGHPPIGHRPDLIGFGVGGWYVIEAKGRQVARKDVIDDAERQALAHHPHRPSATAVASIACLRARRWTVLWRVPKTAPVGRRPDAVMRAALTAYYAPVVNAWRQLRTSPVDDRYSREVETDDDHVSAVIPNVDAVVVVPRAIVDAVDSEFSSVEKPDQWVRQWSDESLNAGGFSNDDNERTALDGIGIRLGPSWSIG